MKRLSLLFCLFSLPALLTVGSSFGQDKKTETKKEDLPKVQLPKGWGKIGIGEQQKGKILDVLRSYESKIDALEKQIEALKTEKLAEAYKLLNDAQKDELKAVEKKKDDNAKKGKVDF